MKLQQISSGTSAANPHAPSATMAPQTLQRSTSTATAYSGNGARPAIRYIDCGSRQRGEDLGTALRPFDWPLMPMR